MGIFMGKMIWVAALAGCLMASAASAQVYVDGYTRQDGTYVQPHYRSAPDGNPYNNYSTQGNTNPYTGQQGTVNPYGSSYNPPSGSSYNHNNRYGSSSGR